MKLITCLLIFLCAGFLTAQTDLDFDMDVTNGTIGEYADVTYTVTNLSPTETYTNVTVNHPDAVIPMFTFNPSTLGPGIQVTATGRIPVGGDPVNGSLPILGFTQATVNADLNGTSVNELSDGLDPQGNRVDNGISYYQISEPQSYGFIYIDNDLDNVFTANVDSGISGAVINAVNSDGISIQTMTNEAGWWNMDPPINVTSFMDDFVATIDQNSFPTAVNSYSLIEGSSPFLLSLLFAFNFQYKHGYADAPASISDVNRITTYPNPLVSNLLNISIVSGSYELYSIAGQLLVSGDFENSNILFRDLETGLYLLRVQNQESQQTLKVVKE